MANAHGVAKTSQSPGPLRIDVRTIAQFLPGAKSFAHAARASCSRFMKVKPATHCIAQFDSHVERDSRAAAIPRPGLTRRKVTDY
jgi:hypothetical protein